MGGVGIGRRFICIFFFLSYLNISGKSVLNFGFGCNECLSYKVLDSGVSTIM